MHDEEKRAVLSHEAGGEAARGAASEALGTVALSTAFNTEAFVCSRSARVQAFLRGDAQRYQDKNYARTFVWPDPDEATQILGYYSLAACLVEKPDLINRYDRTAEKGIPVPVVRIGYMGKRDGAAKGFGSTLILDAARRVSRIEEIGIWGLALDAENEGLVGWYKEQGLVSAKRNPLFMYGPLGTFLA